MLLDLAVCVPTYNRGPYLAQLMNSIFDQPRDGVAVVVSDNCSTDETEAVLAEFLSRDLPLSVYRQPSNLGPGRNFLEAIARSNARHCWLMGSDDAIAPDAFEKARPAFERQPDIVFFNVTVCDKAMVPILSHRWLKMAGDQVFDFSQAGEIERFFSNAQPLWGPIFGYLSSVAVKRNAWDTVALTEEQKSGVYSFTCIVMELIRRGATLAYVEAPVVIYRGDNDSVVENQSMAAAYRRSMHDLTAYAGFSAMFETESQRLAYAGVARRNYTPYVLWKLRMVATVKQWHEEVLPLLADLGIAPAYLPLLSGVGVLRKVYNLAVNAKRLLLPGRRLIGSNFY